MSSWFNGRDPVSKSKVNDQGRYLHVDLWPTCAHAHAYTRAYTMHTQSKWKETRKEGKKGCVERAASQIEGTVDSGGEAWPQEASGHLPSATGKLILVPCLLSPPQLMG